MNFLDNLVSNSICQFSSNFTSTCFLESDDVKINKKNTLDVAKSLYKLQYTLDKKFRALKYFVFVSLEQLPKTSSQSQQIVEPKQEKQLFNQQKIVRLGESIEYINQKHYKISLKVYAFQQLIKNRDSYIFAFSTQMQRLLSENNSQMKSIGFTKLKQNQKLYTKIDILFDLLLLFSSKVKKQKLNYGFDCLKSNYLESYKENRIKLVSKHIEKQVKTDYQEIEEHFQILKVTQFRTQGLEKLEKELFQSNPDLQENLTSSVNSEFQIDELAHALTPTKTDKSSVSKKKVSLSSKRVHSRSISLYKHQRNQVNMKANVPTKLVPYAHSITITIKTQLQPISFESLLPSQDTSRALRSLFPDQIPNELGDIADNLTVFPWQGSNDNLMRSARLSAFSMIPSQNSITRKKQSLSSLTRSSNLNINIQQLFQSSQLKRINQTNPVKNESSISKKIKASCIDRKPKLLQRNPSDYKTPHASQKLLSFLKNQTNQTNTGNINKTLPFKMSNQENRSKLRNSVNIQGTQKRTQQLQEVIVVEPSKKPKVIRKFSPITFIREKLTNSMK